MIQYSVCLASELLYKALLSRDIMSGRSLGTPALLLMKEWAASATALPGPSLGVNPIAPQQPDQHLQRSVRLTEFRLSDTENQSRSLVYLGSGRKSVREI